MTFPNRMPPPFPPQPRPRRSHGCLYAFLGGVGVVGVLIVVIIAVAIGGSGGDGGGKKAQARDDGARPSATARTAGIGHPVKDGKFTFTVLSTSTRTEVGDPDIVGKRAQGTYLVVKIKVRNHGDEPQSLTDTAQELYGAGGKKFQADSEAGAYANGNDQVLYNDINPGNTVTGLLLFDVPKTFHPGRIVLHDSVFSAGAAVDLRRG